ncbi:MAG: CatA-like O-acetyltransferase [Oscillospiraceae bacterium]
MQPLEIDMKTYRRLEHYTYFSQMRQPYLGVTVNIDITDFRHTIKRAAIPFFLTVLHRIARAANSVPELRQRVTHGRIVEYPWCDTSHTVALADGTYCYCRLCADMPLRDFLPYAQKNQEEAKRLRSLDDGDESDSLLFISSLPRLSYTALIQPTPEPTDYNPRITIGGFFETEGKTRLPVSILANHALVDGQHITQFYDHLAALIRNTPSEL